MWKRKRYLFLLLMLALPMDSMMLAAERTRSRPNKAERVRAKRTLDDVVLDVRARTEADGSRAVSTALTEAIPYGEFVDMMRAVDNDEVATSTPAPLSTPPDSPYVCQLVPGDQDNDGDGWTTCNGDCDDGNPNVNPGQSEICSTGFDDDCDGYVNEGCGGGCRKKCPNIYQQP